MKYRSAQHGVILGMALCLLLVMALPAGASHLRGWKSRAYRHFQEDEYDRSLRAMEGYRKDRFAKILTTFIHHQEWVYSKSEVHAELWKADYKALTVSVGIKDIDDLALIAQERDKPSSAKLAKKLLKRAFDNIHKNSDVPLLVEYLAVDDQDINKYAMSSLRRILKARRTVVSKGGSLRVKDIKMMKDRKLIGQLAAIVGQEKVYGRDPSFPKGIKYATQCLVLIEEPSLAALEETEGISAAKAKTKVQRAMASRIKKYPKSNWYSAVGKKRG